jgi:hypothetical protein
VEGKVISIVRVSFYEMLRLLGHRAVPMQVPFKHSLFPRREPVYRLTDRAILA